MKQYQIIVDGQPFDIRLLSDPQRDEVEVEINGERLTVKLRTEAVSEEAAVPSAVSPAAPRPIVPAMASTSKTVVAPLPGVVKSIAVHPGEEVAVGDELLVIEAMKMDNIIRAPRVGIVSILHTAEGRQVVHGEPLLEYCQ